LSNWTYEERMLIPLYGDNYTNFYGPSGNLLACGYTRVVIGKRGPYIEFESDMINWDEWTNGGVTLSSHFYYIEYRSVIDNIKAYKQRYRVDYADYIPGKVYISPFDIVTSDGVIIKDIKKSESVSDLEQEII